MAGKKRVKPEDRIIMGGFALSPKLKLKIEEQARLQNRNFSNYICNILRQVPELQDEVSKEL